MPDKITSSNADVYAVRRDDHFDIHFPFNRDAVAKVKEAFFRPKWHGVSKVWTISLDQEDALDAGLECIADIFAEAEDVSVALEGKLRNAIPTINLKIEILDGEFAVWTAYNTQIVRCLKIELAGRWDAGRDAWILPLASVDGFLHNAEWVARTSEESGGYKPKKKEVPLLVLEPDLPSIGDEIETPEGIRKVSVISDYYEFRDSRQLFDAYFALCSPEKQNELLRNPFWKRTNLYKVFLADPQMP
jgi:hypothetical protein